MTNLWVVESYDPRDSAATIVEFIFTDELAMAEWIKKHARESATRTYIVKEYKHADIDPGRFYFTRIRGAYIPNPPAREPEKKKPQAAPATPAGISDDVKVDSHARYMAEYIHRLARSLGQFWPADEELPNEEAREMEIYYKVAINRLSSEEKTLLSGEIRYLADPHAKFFDKEFCESRGAIQRIMGIIDRFPALNAAFSTEKLLFMRRHNFVV